MIDVASLCDPAHFVLLVTLVSFVVELVRMRVYNGTTITMLLILVFSQLYVAVSLDVFCKAGHKQFAWAVVLLSVLMFLGFDRMIDWVASPFQAKKPAPARTIQPVQPSQQVNPIRTPVKKPIVKPTPMPVKPPAREAEQHLMAYNDFPSATEAFRGRR